MVKQKNNSIKYVIFRYLGHPILNCSGGLDRAETVLRVSPVIFCYS